MRVAPFPTNPVLLAIIMGFVNARMIADLVLPRMKVGKQEYKYLKYEKGQFLIIPETRIGRKGKPNTVEFQGTVETGTCFSDGLDYDIPFNDFDNAPQGVNLVNQATEWVSNLVALAREKRVAALVFDDNNYDSNHKTSLSGNHLWNLTHADADPVEDISNAIEACFMRPTDMTIGNKAFSRLRRNSNIIKAVSASGTDKGLATRAAIQDLFELERINVGEAWVNTAKKGQAANIERLWGNDCLLHYTDPMVTNPNAGMTFGFTAEFKKFAGAKEDSDIGPEGGTKVRAGEYVDEHIMAPDCAYLIKNVCS